MAAEGGAEGAGRAVAHALRRFGDAGLTAPQFEALRSGPVINITCSMPLPSMPLVAANDPSERLR